MINQQQHAQQPITTTEEQHCGKEKEREREEEEKERRMPPPAWGSYFCRPRTDDFEYCVQLLLEQSSKRTNKKSEAEAAGDADCSSCFHSREEAILAVEDYLFSLQLTKADIERIRHIPQKSQEWLNVRAGRLTASNFGAVNGTNKYVSKRQLLTRLVWPEKNTFRGNWATRHGNEHEDEACILYETWKQYQLQDLGLDPLQIKIEHTGLVISHRYPWLGGSPDFIAHYYDDDHSQCPGRNSLSSSAADAAAAPIISWLGEIKCPFPKKDPTSNPPGQMVAKCYDTIPPYYYDQIQGLMAILELPFADFVVWTAEKTKIQRFQYDRDYVETVLFPNLQSYFIRELLPRWILKRKGLLEEQQHPLRAAPPSRLTTSCSISSKQRHRRDRRRCCSPKTLRGKNDDDHYCCCPSSPPGSPLLLEVPIAADSL